MTRLLLAVAVVLSACASPPRGLQQLFVVNRTSAPLQVKVGRATLDGEVVGIARFEDLRLLEPLTLTAVSGDREVERVGSPALELQRDLVWFVAGAGRHRLVDYSFLYSMRPELSFGAHGPDSITEVLGADAQRFVDVPRGAVVIDTSESLPRSVQTKANLDKRSVLRIEQLPEGDDDGRQAWIDRVNAELPKAPTQ